MSKIIKASQITGEYKLKDRFKRLENKSPEEQEEIKQGKEEMAVTEEYEQGNIDKLPVVEKAREEAEKILDEAQKEAEEYLAGVRQEAEEIKNQAYEEGFAAGKEEGFKAGLGGIEAKVEKLAITFEKAITEIKEDIEARNERLGREVIQLAVKIGSKIVNARLKIEPELINNIVMDMIKDMESLGEINVLLHPELLQYIDEDEFNSTFVRQKIHFTGDRNLEAGDCIVESNLGGRDGSLENKLTMIEKELLKGAGYHEGT